MERIGGVTKRAKSRFVWWTMDAFLQRLEKFSSSCTAVLGFEEEGNYCCRHRLLYLPGRWATKTFPPHAFGVRWAGNS